MTHLEKMEFFGTKNHFTYSNDWFVILLFGLTVDRVIEQSRCVTKPYVQCGLPKAYSDGASPGDVINSQSRRLMQCRWWIVWYVYSL